MIQAFVGGKEFDAHGLAALLGTLPLTDTVVVGSGIGSEKFIREQAPEFGLRVEVPPLRPDLYDWPVEEVGTPPEAFTRMHMNVRLEQAMAWGDARRAQREDGKTRNALACQVNDVVFLALHARLTIIGKGSRATIARDILKRGKMPVEVIEV